VFNIRQLVLTDIEEKS